MNLINILIIILILYLCYKIVVFNENTSKNEGVYRENFSNENIDLSSKQVLLGRNLFVGVKQKEVEKYNTLKKDGKNVLDLSKNNLVIKENKNNEVKINQNICFDNFCINSKQMELIGGEIDAPNFRKNDKPVYYNHDSETKFSDLPDKLCFKNKDEDTGETNFTCLDYHDFEILNGERGI